MQLHDRLTRGFIAGLAGGIVMNIISLATYYGGLNQLRFLDWAGIVIYGFQPESFWYAAFAQLVQLIFVGLLGIVFAYLVTRVTSLNYLLKGWLFGVAVWFALYGLTLLYKISATIPSALGTSVSSFIGASAYGLVLAEVLSRYDTTLKA